MARNPKSASNRHGQRGREQPMAIDFGELDSKLAGLEIGKFDSELAALFEMPLEMTPDHPLARRIGFEKAKAFAELPRNRRTALAAHHRKEIERLSLAGWQVEAIAKQVKLSTGYVVQIRRELDLGNISQKRSLAATVDLIRELNGKGMSDGKISTAIKRDRGYVCNLRKRHGIAAVPASKRSQ